MFTGQKSYSHGNDYALGQPVADRFTALTLGFGEALASMAGPGAGAGSSSSKKGSATLEELTGIYRWENLVARAQLSWHGICGWHAAASLRKSKAHSSQLQPARWH